MTIPSMAQVLESADGSSVIQRRRQNITSTESAREQLAEAEKGDFAIDEFVREPLRNFSEAARHDWARIEFHQDGMRDYDGQMHWRMLAFQPFQPVDGIENDPSDGWGNERSERYFIHLAQFAHNTAGELTIHEANNQINWLTQKRVNDSASKRVDGLEGRLRFIEDSLVEKDRKIEDLENQINSLKSSCEEYRGDIEKLFSRIGNQNIKDELARLKLGLNYMTECSGMSELPHVVQQEMKRYGLGNDSR